MGCSAGMISIALAKDLQANPNSLAVVVSMENITLNWYFENDKSMLLCNCIFRMGGAVILLSKDGEIGESQSMNLFIRFEHTKGPTTRVTIVFSSVKMRRGVLEFLW